MKRLFISSARGKLAISALRWKMEDVGVLQACCSVSNSLESFLLIVN